MSRRKRPPLRQPRGPRATLPSTPRAAEPTVLEVHYWGLGCEDCGHWHDECTCERPRDSVRAESDSPSH